jgi:predicted ATPase
MLDYVLLDGRRIDIGTGRFRFVDYFDIDSMSVLIGKNGSGKTRTLIGLAEALTSGPMFNDSIGTSYTDENGVRIEHERSYASSELGAIYYTSIPFRRKMRRGRTLIEASSLGGGVREEAKMRLFKKIARDLDPDINPGVTAFVSYPASTIQRVLYQALLEPDVELFDVARNANLTHIRSLRAAQASIRPPEQGGLPDAADSALRSIERDLREREGELFAYLTDWADNTPDVRMERLSWLAALSKAVPSDEARAKGTVRGVLHHLGLAAVDHDQVDQQGFAKVSELASRTFSVLIGLSAMTLMHDDEREINFEIEDDGLYQLLCRENTAIEFRWENLSSGLLAIVEQFAALDVAVKRLSERGCKSALLLLDEPDAFLHLEWQRRYIDLLNTFLGDLKRLGDFDSLQVVIATHSPVIAADLPGAMVQSLDPDGRRFKTFAAPIDDLIYQSFDSNSMGEYASRKIRELHLRARERRLSERDQALIAEIADEGLRRAILDTNDN